jgi:hypothetical protein
MKYLGQALIVCLLVGLAIFGVSYPFLKSTHVAESIAALPLLACRETAEWLEQLHAKRSLAEGKKLKIQSFEGFAISWPIMAIGGALLLAAIVEVTSAFVGIVFAIAAAGNTEIATKAGLYMSLPVMMVGAYFVGRWIGTRTRSYGIAVVFLMAFLVSLMAHAFDMSISSAQFFQSIMGAAKSIHLFFLQLVATFVFQLPTALLGYWRGSRRRVTKYFDYLLAVLPADTKNAIVDLAYQEVQARKVSTPPPLLA